MTDTLIAVLIAAVLAGLTAWAGVRDKREQRRLEMARAKRQELLAEAEQIRTELRALLNEPARIVLPPRP